MLPRHASRSFVTGLTIPSSLQQVQGQGLDAEEPAVSWTKSSDCVAHICSASSSLYSRKCHQQHTGRPGQMSGTAFGPLGLPAGKAPLHLMSWLPKHLPCLLLPSISMASILFKTTLICHPAGEADSPSPESSVSFNHLPRSNESSFRYTSLVT